MAVVELELYRTEGLGDKINKKAGNPVSYLFPPGFEIVVAINVDEKNDPIFKAYTQNEHLKNIIDVACKNPGGKGQTAIKNFIANFAGGLNTINGFVNQGRLDEAEASYLNFFRNEVFGPHVEGIIEAMVIDIDAALKEQKDIKKQYKGYQLKTAGKIVFTSAGLALNVTVNAIVIGTSGFHFGAGTVLSVIGLSKSVIALADIAVDLLKSTDRAINEAVSVFETVLADHNKKNKGWKWEQFGNAKQFTEEMINTVIHELTALPKPFDTLDRAREKLTLAESKLAGTGVQLIKLGRKITKIKNKIAKLQERIEAASRDAAGLKTPKGMKLDMKKLVATKRQLEVFEQKLGKKDDVYVGRKVRLKAVREAFDAIKKEHTITEKTNTALKVALLALQAAASVATMDFGSLMSVTTTVADIGISLAGNVYDKAVDLYAQSETEGDGGAE